MVDKSVDGCDIFVFDHSPGLRCAETEVIRRLQLAATNRGLDCVVLPADLVPGGDVSPQRSRPVSCGFGIALHPLARRPLNVPSYYAMWQPPEFYSRIGYPSSVRSAARHSYVLSGGSSVSDNITVGLLRRFRPNLELARNTLLPSVAEPLLAPHIGATSRASVVGFNWDRRSGGPGRMGQMLRVLDGMNVCDFYGPSRVLDFEPWSGFRNYQGEIDFDGVSVLRVLNSNGIALVLNSLAHRRSGLLSSRFFEAVGAGAAVITHHHPFIDRHFADLVYFVEDRPEYSAEVMAVDVATKVDEIRADPLGACCRAARAQAVLRQNYTLDVLLERLYLNHLDRSELSVR